MSLSSQEAIYWYNVQNQLQSCTKIVLNCDNQSAMSIAENIGYNPRTKHISIRYHFIREIIKTGKLQLQYIPTNNQTADVMTKGLQRIKHKQMCELLNLIKLSNQEC